MHTKTDKGNSMLVLQFNATGKEFFVEFDYNHYGTKCINYRNVVKLIQTTMRHFTNRQKETKRLELKRKMEIHDYFHQKAVTIQKM